MSTNIVASAKPIDWLSVALAFSMPVIVALETFLQANPQPNVPPLGSALIVAALGSLVVQIDAIRKSESPVSRERSAPPSRPGSIARLRAAWRWLDIDELLFGFCCGAASGFVGALLYSAAPH